MTSPRAFITGIAGFAGSWLARELLDKGYEVHGAIYSKHPRGRLRELRKSLQLYDLNILNPERCREVIADVRPHYIFHLAAQASVGQSFDKERLTYKLNFDGTLNILQAAAKRSDLKALLFVSSSDCFGPIRAADLPLAEDHPCQPISPYGLSKLAGEHLCRYYHSQYDVPTIIARAFNHSGPGQDPTFVISAFARQIAEIEAGKQRAVLKVGDLSPKRDFSDVRDIVLGYRLLAEKGKAGDTYHLCSGKATSIKAMLNSLLKNSEKKITVQVDKSRLRKNDVPVVRGDNRKVVQEVGYSPRYTLNDTLCDTLNYWRRAIG
jgi:GDP-4-dehydro-6-deoxy-D-mannose reductase